MSVLTRIVPWSQLLCCEILGPGDLAVDLTAGHGRDTLALAKAVGATGQVVAVDLQAGALSKTSALLREHGFATIAWPAGQPLPRQSGIFLVQACHSTLVDLLPAPARAVIANLGYLPGGDRALITQPDSTCAALRHALTLLNRGGRLAVTVYPGHPGGIEELDAVDQLFRALPANRWAVLAVQVANCRKSPSLLVAESLG